MATLRFSFSETETSQISRANLLRDRLRGTFYGTAVGDALGGPRQFCERDEMPLLTEMKPISNFRMPGR